jgi:hypothetical protein
MWLEELSVAYPKWRREIEDVVSNAKLKNEEEEEREEDRCKMSAELAEMA